MNLVFENNMKHVFFMRRRFLVLVLLIMKDFKIPFRPSTRFLCR